MCWDDGEVVGGGERWGSLVGERGQGVAWEVRWDDGNTGTLGWAEAREAMWEAGGCGCLGWLRPVRGRTLPGESLMMMAGLCWAPGDDHVPGVAVCPERSATCLPRAPDPIRDD